MPVLNDFGTDVRLSAQLEGGLEQVGLQPHRGVKRSPAPQRLPCPRTCRSRRCGGRWPHSFAPPKLGRSSGYARDRVTSKSCARHQATTGLFMKAPSLSKSIPFKGKGNSVCAARSAFSTSAPDRNTTVTHSVQPVAMSVSTSACTKAPAVLTPECATKSTSRKPAPDRPSRRTSAPELTSVPQSCRPARVVLARPQSASQTAAGRSLPN